MLDNKAMRYNARSLAASRCAARCGRRALQRMAHCAHFALRIAHGTAHCASNSARKFSKPGCLNPCPCCLRARACALVGKVPCHFWLVLVGEHDFFWFGFGGALVFCVCFVSLKVHKCDLRVVLQSSGAPMLFSGCLDRTPRVHRR